MQPKVSVVVPVYNVEKYLPQCLDSLLKQTLKDIEVICVNGGSPDNCAAILEEYAKKDSRIKVITRDNGGLSRHRNTGMEHATGKYLAFVDSDDFVAEDMMEKLYNRAEQTQAEITVGDLWLYFHDTGKTAYFRDQAQYIFLKHKVFSIQDYPDFVKNIAAWDRLYLRSFIERIEARFVPDLIYEDQPFTVYTLLNAKRIAMVPEQFYYYRKNAGESMTDKEATQSKYKYNFLRAVKIVLDMLTGEENQAVRREYVDFMIFSAHMHQKNSLGDRRLFREFFKEMRQLLTQDDYDNLLEDVPQMEPYILCLKNNKCGEARRLLRA